MKYLNMVSLMAVMITITMVNAIDFNNAFLDFVLKYNKEYSTPDEYVKRFEIFKQNYELILKTQDQIKWRMQINEFADMNWNEFKSAKLNDYFFVDTDNKKNNHFCANYGESCIEKNCCGQMKCALKSVTNNLKTRVCDNGVSINAGSLDWRTKGVVNKVKDQKSCGSCWAFSAIGSLESRCSIATGQLVSLSEQQLVDCSSAYGNKRCKGGLMKYAFDYLKNSTGSCLEKKYPYIEKGGVCKKAGCNMCKISGYQPVEQSDIAMEEALLSGPISVGIAVNEKFQFYSGGVFDDPDCDTNLNHGVVVVGYTPEYWIVRNSWGENWGVDNGYIYIKRGKNMCGIELDVLYPLLST